MITGIRFLRFDDKMDFSIFGLYDRDKLVTEYMHYNTPQEYRYELTENNTEMRVYVKGAFKAGKFSEGERDLIEAEIRSKWPELDAQKIEDCLLSFAL